MANYVCNITDNLNGTWTITNVVRGATTVTISGGNNLNNNTTTSAINQITGLPTSATGFQDAATTTSDGLGHQLMSPLEALERCKALIADDRAFNGN